MLVCLETLPPLRSTAAKCVTASYQWQSNGFCKTTCQANYALAIVQGSNCWCSNYIPADQLSVSSDCSKKCQGYGFENCGNDDTGTFGYVLLDKSPSGTASASQASDTSSASSELSSQVSISSNCSHENSGQASSLSCPEAACNLAFVIPHYTPYSISVKLRGHVIVAHFELALPFLSIA